MKVADPSPKPSSPRWFNSAVLGVGLASLFSDWSHETATTLLPAFLATLGAGPAWVGVIEGVSDGLSSAAKLASGFFTDRLRRRKPVAVAGYIITALGTASFGLATGAWQVLGARATAWLGRGVRTPVRKAILAGAVPREAYGRAFGFERMLDTIGALAGPATALALLPVVNHNYRAVFAFTLLPGLAAALMIGWLVPEKERKPVPHISLGASLRALPRTYRKFLLAAGLFGAGDFAPTLLLLLAAQSLQPRFGVSGAAAAAASLYLLRNLIHAGAALLVGRLADRHDKGRLLIAAWLLALLMAIVLAAGSKSLATLGVIFALAGCYTGMVETLEDSFCAELTSEHEHGVAFGLLATVNGLGDFASSIIVGLLWSAANARLAFLYCAALFLAAVLLLARSAGSRRSAI